MIDTYIYNIYIYSLQTILLVGFIHHVASTQLGKAQMSPGLRKRNDGTLSTIY